MSAVPKISNFGARVDLELRQGGTLYPVKQTLKNPDGTPLNLSGCTVRGQIRVLPKSSGSPVCAFDIVMGPSAEGWYTFGLTDDVTAAIPCGNSPASPDSQFWYDIELVDAGGAVRELLYGAVTVKAEVTR